jgi:hypothetical protein
MSSRKRHPERTIDVDNKRQRTSSDNNENFSENKLIERLIECIEELKRRVDYLESSICKKESTPSYIS